MQAAFGDEVREKHADRGEAAGDRGFGGAGRALAGHVVDHVVGLEAVPLGQAGGVEAREKAFEVVAVGGDRVARDAGFDADRIEKIGQVVAQRAEGWSARGRLASGLWLSLAGRLGLPINR